MIALVLWACLWPITWSVVEYVDSARYRILIPEPKKENESFDDLMLGIYLIGFAAIIMALEAAK